jgi:hypothetical protein
MEYDSPMRRVVAFILAIGLTACGASASSTNGPSTGVGERYPIVLHRDAVVGSRAHVTSVSTHREETMTTFRGQVVDAADATSAYRLDAIVETLAIDAQGKPVELRYDVRSFTRTEGQLTTEVLRPGQVIALTTAERREDARILVDAAPISEELAAALDEVLTLTRSTEEDDAYFGSIEPRAVGERWQADVAGIANGLGGHSPLRIDPSHLRGEARVVERTEIDGVDGLTIAVAIDADQVRVDGLADGASVRDGRVAIRLDGFFPIDPALPRLREGIALTAELAMSISTPQGSADVALTMTMTTLRTVQPL